jgi:putative redox protein
MKARAKWVEGMAFMGEAGSGHAIMMDGAPEYGGRNIGIRPMEMLLIGLAGCTGFDVVQILKKGPKVFTKIHLGYRISGPGLSPAKVERAVTLSKEKYCSASIMLGATAEFTYAIDIVDEMKKVAAE